MQLLRLKIACAPLSLFALARQLSSVVWQDFKQTEVVPLKLPAAVPLEPVVPPVDPPAVMSDKPAALVLTAVADVPAVVCVSALLAVAAVFAVV